MEKETLTIVWAPKVFDTFSEAYDYIRQDSFQNAEKVRSEILDAIESAAEIPTRNPVDKYKINNLGNYRAFELHSYRISYSFDSEKLYVLRFRHVKMKPKKY